jgi:hypothetical protein
MLPAQGSFSGPALRLPRLHAGQLQLPCLDLPVQVQLRILLGLVLDDLLQLGGKGVDPRALAGPGHHHVELVEVGAQRDRQVGGVHRQPLHLVHVAGVAQFQRQPGVDPQRGGGRCPWASLRRLVELELGQAPLQLDRPDHRPRPVLHPPLSALRLTGGPLRPVDLGEEHAVTDVELPALVECSRIRPAPFIVSVEPVSPDDLRPNPPARPRVAG